MYPNTRHGLDREIYFARAADDPDQTINLWDSQPERRERMLETMRRMIADEGAPPEQVDRFGLA